MKKFIAKIVLVLLPIFIMLVSVNYFGDAANLFSKNFEMKLAEGILTGSNVTNVTDYNERLLQKYLVPAIHICPDLLVLGSSRSMEINKTYFPGITFFNNSVSGATIEDIIGIYELYEKKNCHPKNLILCLDPWTLNKNNNQIRWLSLATEYNTFLRESNIDTVAHAENTNVLAQLISPSYFNASLQSLRHPKKVQLISTANNEGFTRMNDGSVSYGTDHRGETIAEIREKAKEFGAVNNIYSVEKFDELSPSIRHVLELFIARLRSENVSVTFYLSPYNPYVYHVFQTNSQYKMIDQSESYYRVLAAKNNITVLGSYDPAKVNMDETFFYDGMHCNTKGVATLISGYHPIQ